MIIPVVTSDIDPAAVEELIGLCVEYDRIRAHAQGRAADAGPETDNDGIGCPDAQAAGDPHDSAAAGAGPSAEALAMLEHQILGTVMRVMSGPGGVASFLMGIWQVTAGRSRGS